ncbi:hypothetical protein ACFO0N_04345 [Halobium salinum]|uniref:Right handed beta helix region n=1 Tax=Halobium salinum TaxID=1364940 RepID=A0ABD5P8W0_9EURY|nr:hypothetical protein [Halobium salinum]
MFSRRKFLSSVMVSAGVAAVGRNAAVGTVAAEEPVRAAPSQYEYEPPELLTQGRPLGGGPWVGKVAGTGAQSPHIRYFEAGPTVRPGDATHVAETPDELVEAVEGARPGDVIWLPENRFDFTAFRRRAPLTISTDNVTVASGRGITGHGARLFTANETDPLIRVTGDGVRLTGMRIEADWPEYVPRSQQRSLDWATGVSIEGHDVAVDNCVVRGWTQAGIEIGRHGTVNDYPLGTFVHNNDIVDNACYRRGYGVVVYRGEPFVWQNYFDHNRHAVASSGAPRCSYHLRRNLIGSRTTSHHIDMHDYSEVTGDASDAGAGQRITVHENTVLAGVDVHGGEYYRSAVRIRGEPRSYASIRDNVLAYPDSMRTARDNSVAAIRATTPDGREHDPSDLGISVAGNRYGSLYPVRVGVNGDRILERREMAVVGTGNGSTYVVRVSGEISGTSDTERGEDWTGTSVAEGNVRWLSDNYHYTGEITGFEVLSGDPDVDVWANGSKYAPWAFPDVTTRSGDSDGSSLDGDGTASDPVVVSDIAVVGSGTRTRYRFEVSGDLEAGDNLESGDDVVRGPVAEGSVKWSSDTYRFSGFVTDFEVLSGDPGVDIWVDGAKFAAEEF